MSLLTLDFGNTAVKGGVFTLDGELTHHWRNDYTNASEYIINLSGVTACYYCSVTPKKTRPIINAIKNYFNLAPEKVRSITPGQTPLPVTLKNYPPNQLGPDRLVNACGLVNYYPDEYRLIYDFGTATTIDVLGPENVFEGGCITVGLEQFWSLLNQKTERLPDIPMEAPSKLIGQNTLESLQLGLAGGYTGLITELERRLIAGIKEVDPKTDIHKIITGGLVEKFVEISEQQLFDVNQIKPLLTLMGLYQVWQNKGVEGLV